ncbi:protein-glutamate O-methyltransferase CheR [Sphingomonadales bacterium 56]|uniref:CheR family methyltransferase n=1 Tax=unclassified Sphingobium TaxID=2611147 RepID=UPI0019182FD6|nr:MULTISPECIES: protein-glutamate O-methyltransferase CheR [unclassified Sphingobium]MBY2928550.1 protein-glutamate O-methyltransferase CheR [Sphingomonadales bacterium 56]MBY2959602.1 protein-glutamate O-methyltransferase CheR [Sphingomonadales bacterium 58]CAD7337535.1 Chemotaxis protein methyltransferase Cher2 [Sphingobium sp. S6]CAD7339323.1 Chemotaxis protein methyltransferase Cher2 [Sphingobium sp. S8]
MTLSTDSSSRGAARIFSGLLEARTGQILSESRAWRMETALKPVMRANGVADMDELATRLLGNRDPRLEEEVVNALLNNESSFFRDLQIFDMINRHILPSFAERRERVLRIWSAGCSTGQEVYSLAIQLRNDAARWRGWRIEILATDISTAAIDQARSGIFSQMDVQRGLAVGDLIKWFEPAGDNWRASPELRRMIDFRTDNLFEPKAPSGDYDLLLCRNVLLYFTPERRQEVFRLMTRHSHDRSVLLLGAGETVIGHSDDFIPHPEFRGGYGRRPEAAHSSEGIRRAV